MGQWGIETLLTDTLIHQEPEPETLLLLQTDGDTNITEDPQLDMKCEI